MTGKNDATEERNPLLFLDEPDGDEPNVEAEGKGEGNLAPQPEAEGQEAPTAQKETQGNPPEGASSEQEDDISPDAQGMVPHAALHAARQRQKDLQRQLDELKGKQTQDQQPPADQQQQFVPPDPVKDPAGFAQYQEQRFQFTLLNERLNTSERFARQQHGEEAVVEAFEWFKGHAEKDPGFYQRVVHSPDPYGNIMQLFAQAKKQEIFAGLDEQEFEDFKKWKAAQAQVNGGGQNPAPQQSAKPASQAPAKPKPPKSLNSAPNDGNTGPSPLEANIGPGKAFEDMFD